MARFLATFVAQELIILNYYFADFRNVTFCIV